MHINLHHTNNYLFRAQLHLPFIFPQNVSIYYYTFFFISLYCLQTNTRYLLTKIYDDFICYSKQNTMHFVYALTLLNLLFLLSIKSLTHRHYSIKFISFIILVPTHPYQKQSNASLYKMFCFFFLCCFYFCCESYALVFDEKEKKMV